MAIAVVLLPLLAAFIAAFGALFNEAEKRLFLVAACFCVFAAGVLATILFINLQSEDYIRVIPIYSWIEAGPFRVSWGLRIDSLSALMMAMVTTVSALVHFYSLGYMEHERGRPRFFFALGLFTFAMLMLVSAENLLQLFLGWEAVGFCSYLLIGFWWRKPAATDAAVKAFIVNRIGDLGLILAMCALFAMFGNLDFSTLFALIPIHDELQLGGFPAYEVVTLLLFLAAMGKSAQLGLHTWLPDAMEGPTPVSALIHAATMVTAGVFLLARMSPLFALAPFALGVVTAIGIATALFAALVAATQNDIKRIIAWSTCSQLGYMFAALGAAAWGAAIFHLLTHAFFKALLFLAAGAVIHAVGEQDIRKLGGLRNKMPFTHILMAIGAASLAGVPFFAGYYSKDFILETVAIESPLVAALGLLAAVATAFYSYRLVRGIFYGKPGCESARNAHEVGGVMGVPMFILALGAIFSGYGFYEFLVGSRQYPFWGSSVEIISQTAVFGRAHETAHLVPFLAMGAIVIGIALHFLPSLKGRRLKKSAAVFNFLNFLKGGAGFDYFYRRFLVIPYRRLADNLWKFGDTAMIQKQWVEGTALKVRALGVRTALVHNGRLYRYALVMLLSVTFAVLWVSFGYD